MKIKSEGSFALGDDDVDKVDYTTTSSWNGHSTQCMLTLLYCILSSSPSANSPIDFHATHSWRQIKLKLLSPSANEPWVEKKIFQMLHIVYFKRFYGHMSFYEATDTTYSAYQFYCLLYYRVLKCSPIATRIYRYFKNNRSLLKELTPYCPESRNEV